MWASSVFLSNSINVVAQKGNRGGSGRGLGEPGMLAGQELGDVRRRPQFLLGPKLCWAWSGLALPVKEVLTEWWGGRSPDEGTGGLAYWEVTAWYLVLKLLVSTTYWFVWLGANLFTSLRLSFLFSKMGPIMNMWKKHAWAWGPVDSGEWLPLRRAWDGGGVQKGPYLYLCEVNVEYCQHSTKLGDRNTGVCYLFLSCILSAHLNYSTIKQMSIDSIICRIQNALNLRHLL